jgi:hypothetical protein
MRYRTSTSIDEHSLKKTLSIDPKLKENMYRDLARQIISEMKIDDLKDLFSLNEKEEFMWGGKMIEISLEIETNLEEVLNRALHKAMIQENVRRDTDSIAKFVKRYMNKNERV